MANPPAVASCWPPRPTWQALRTTIGRVDPTFAVAYVYRLQELTTSRRIADVKARLQRTNPVDQALEYNRMFGELVMLEQHRRKLREGAVAQPGGHS